MHYETVCVCLHSIYLFVSWSHKTLHRVALSNQKSQLRPARCFHRKYDLMWFLNGIAWISQVKFQGLFLLVKFPLSYVFDWPGLCHDPPQGFWMKLAPSPSLHLSPQPNCNEDSKFLCEIDLLIFGKGFSHWTMLENHSVFALFPNALLDTYCKYWIQIIDFIISK